MNASTFEINTKLERFLFRKDKLPTFTSLLIPYLIGSCIKKLKRVHLAPLLRLHRSDVCGLAALEDKRKIPGYQELDILTSAGFQTALAATVRCRVNFRDITQQ